MLLLPAFCRNFGHVAEDLSQDSKTRLRSAVEVEPVDPGGAGGVQESGRYADGGFLSHGGVAI